MTDGEGAMAGAVARLRAFAADRIDWPQAAHIEATGRREHGWWGPYIAGTSLPVAIVGRNLCEDWDDWRSSYPQLADDQLAAARDYYLAHGDLFQAAIWLDVVYDRDYTPNGNRERLQGDIAALLALADEAIAGRDELARLRDALDVYAEPGNWTYADSANPYTGTWYAGNGRQMRDIFLPAGDGADTARRALGANDAN